MDAAKLRFQLRIGDGYWVIHAVLAAEVFSPRLPVRVSSERPMIWSLPEYFSLKPDEVGNLGADGGHQVAQ